MRIPIVRSHSRGDPGGYMVPNWNSSTYTRPTRFRYVTKVQRHVLFEHHQYFVLYDDVATSTNANFEWVYHVFQNSVSNLTQGGSFNYTVSPANLNHLKHLYPWTNINVVVYQVVDPNLLAARTSTERTLTRIP